MSLDKQSYPVPVLVGGGSLVGSTHKLPGQHCCKKKKPKKNKKEKKQRFIAGLVDLCMEAVVGNLKHLLM